MNLAAPIILASTSQWRRQIFKQVGIEADLCAPVCDEEEIKSQLRAENENISAEELALALTRAKALGVSTANPEAYVIAGDQTCSCEGRTFDKPKDIDEAAANLKFFSGKEISLHTGICIFHQGEEIWSTVDDPKLELRHISDEEIHSYLEQEPYALTTCASFVYEGPAIHFFEKIKGTHFSICGVPVLPLSAKLQELDILNY